MKSLIVFYSRTGTTKKIASILLKLLNSDIEEIFDTKNRSGALGYLKSGIDAMTKKLTIIKKTKKNPSSYNLVIIGTPIWVGNISTPIRTYIVKNKKNFKKVAFFCTMHSSGDQKTFQEMEKLCNKKPLSLLTITTKEVSKGQYMEKVQEFVNKLKR